MTTFDGFASGGWKLRVDLRSRESLQLIPALVSSGLGLYLPETAFSQLVILRFC